MFQVLVLNIYADYWLSVGNSSQLLKMSLQVSRVFLSIIGR